MTTCRRRSGRRLHSRRRTNMKPTIVVEQGAIQVSSVLLLSESADLLRFSIDCRSKRFEVDCQEDGVYLWKHKETVRANLTPHPTVITVKHGRRGTWRYMGCGGGRYSATVLVYRETMRRGAHLPVWVDERE